MTGKEVDKIEETEEYEDDPENVFDGLVSTSED